MSCPTCGAIDVGPAGTCTSCGSGLVRICAICRHECAAAARFCQSCGTKLDSPLAIPATVVDAYERRVVTVLFADVMGSLRAISGLDPEEATFAFTTITGLMTEAVEAHGGTVNKRLGDGIMALFGVPVTVELHAIQACLAALALRAALRDRAVRLSNGALLQVRIGLNSGEVVVRRTGLGDSATYDATGEVVHLASRLEQSAPVDGIQAGPGTAEAARGYVEFGPSIPLHVKGLDQPVTVHPLLQVAAQATRLSAAGISQLTGFVNREQQRAALWAARDKVLARPGQGRIVALAGDAGCGKSRLIHEFMSEPGFQGWQRCEGTAVAFGRAGYRTLSGMLRSLLTLEQGDPPARIRQQIEAAAPLTPGAIQALSALCELLPSDPAWRALDPFERRARAMASVCELLRAVSAQRPVVIVIEDLHWVDAESLSVLAGVAKAMAGWRVLLLLTFRPQHVPAWRLDHYEQHAILPLEHDVARTMLRHLLHSSPETGTLEEQLVARTEGNPFFLEECIASLGESGHLRRLGDRWELVALPDEADLPASIRVLLAARMDRLTQPDQEVLQVCSVLGDVINPGLLASVIAREERLLTEPLARLVTLGFIKEASSQQNQERYGFRHALIRDTAYHSILLRHRRLLHGCVVDAIERAGPGAVAENLEVLAEHAHRAQSWPQAAHYARRSAQLAAARDFNAEALRFLGNALEAAKHWPDGPDRLAMLVDLHLEHRFPAFKLGLIEQTAGHLAAASPMAQALGDPKRLSLLHIYQSHLDWLRGRPGPAMAEIDQALSVAAAAGDGAMQARASMQKGLVHLSTGQPREAVAELERALYFPPQLGTNGAELDRSHAATVNSYLTRAFIELGDLDEAERAAQTSLAIAESVDKAMSRMFAWLALGVSAMHRGRAVPAVEWLTRAHRISADANMPLMIPVVLGYLGAAQLASGEAAQAVVTLEDAATRASTIGLVSGQPLRLASLARAYAMTGDGARATYCARRAAELCDATGETAGRNEADRVLTALPAPVVQ